MLCHERLCENPRPQSRDLRRPTRAPNWSKLRSVCSGNSALLDTAAFPNTYPGSSRKPLRVSASACWRELTSGLRKFLETQTILVISIPQL